SLVSDHLRLWSAPTTSSPPPFFSDVVVAFISDVLFVVHHRTRPAPLSSQLLYSVADPGPWTRGIIPFVVCRDWSAEILVLPLS
ncbi:hypothetical protein A2U01_0062593, partial [Trifolium medium]|nr:hypothetical protein [Trifolium medium]